MNKDYVRTSVVAEYIDGLLAEKRALGFSYQFEEYLLNVFDHYCIENSLQDPCFSRQFLEQWLVAGAVKVQAITARGSHLYASFPYT